MGSVSVLVETSVDGLRPQPRRVRTRAMLWVRTRWASCPRACRETTATAAATSRGWVLFTVRKADDIGGGPCPALPTPAGYLLVV